MGATTIVRRCWFISSGEIIRQGRVFRISAPCVGSSDTSHTSSRRGRRLTTSIPRDQIRWAQRVPSAVRLPLNFRQHGTPLPSLHAGAAPARLLDDHFLREGPPFLPSHTVRLAAWESARPVNCRSAPALFSLLPSCNYIVITGDGRGN